MRAALVGLVALVGCGPLSVVYEGTAEISEGCVGSDEVRTRSEAIVWLVTDDGETLIAQGRVADHLTPTHVVFRPDETLAAGHLLIEGEGLRGGFAERVGERCARRTDVELRWTGMWP